ncbi:MAG TPA: hypothetical protein VGD78_14485 [Chthoniobacterales bacterium]
MPVTRKTLVLTSATLTLFGCDWGNPSVENPFPNLRVDVVRRDAPTFTLVVENHSDDRLQVTLLSRPGADGRSGGGQEERFVLSPQGDVSFPLPANTRMVQVTDAHALRQ